MHLRHRRAGYRLHFKLGIKFRNRLAEGLFNLTARQIRIERWYFVLQFGQFHRIIVRNQVGTRRKDLSEFHKHRPQAFQSQPQPHRQGVR